MPRVQNRNVFFHAHGYEIGVLILNTSVNQKGLLQILQILIQSEVPNHFVYQETKVPVVLGIYDILSEGM